MRVLAVNAGSSSLKVRLLGDGDELLAEADALEGLPAPDAVGHRIVHGGETHRAAVVVDERVERELRELTALAPLHQPKSIAALDAARAAFPSVPHVACFDTAFHAGMPAAAATYALPAEWRERWPLRRFGFHGLSHAHAARRAAQLCGEPVQRLRIVSCHLGAGASLAAVAGGRSVDTTMGFTPLEGLVMATRSGSVDPGLVLWLAERLGVEEVNDALEHRSGLAGLAGAADLRDVLEGVDAKDPACTLALGAYVHRLRAEIAAMAAAMGGLDVLVFTGGVGEHAPRIRALAAGGLGFLGVALDAGRNERAGADADVGAGAVRVLVVTAREDLEISRQVRELLAA